MRKVFDTNFFGAMNVTRAVLPHFRGQRKGTLVFMSSFFAWDPVPMAGAYAATKGAMESKVHPHRSIH